MTLAPENERRFFEGLQYATDFFMGKADVYRALEKLAECLEDLAIPYAIVGAMALNEYGYVHVTNVVEVLLTADGLERFQRHGIDRGYAGLRDTENNVTIDVVLAGGYPGDGQPKPVAFPDPAEAQRGARVRLLPLERLIELKLASGMSAPHRLRDLADVLELIRICELPADFASRLDDSVREKFHELFLAARGARGEE